MEQLKQEFFDSTQKERCDSFRKLAYSLVSA